MFYYPNFGYNYNPYYPIYGSFPYSYGYPFIGYGRRYGRGYGYGHRFHKRFW